VYRTVVRIVTSVPPIILLIPTVRRAKKVNQVYKTKTIMDLETMTTFFVGISDIKNIKTILHSQSSSFYVVTISFLSYDCNLLGLFTCKTIFAMLYICKTEPTHTGAASS